MKSYAQIAEEAKRKLKAQKREGKTGEPPDEHRFYERALEMQSTVIENQRKELANLNRIHQMDVRATKVSEAVRFLLDVINNKFRK